MKKIKGETGYLIVFPTRDDGAKAFDLLASKERVYGVAYQGKAAFVLTRRQLRQLDRARIKWRYVTPVQEQNRNKRPAKNRG